MCIPRRTQFGTHDKGWSVISQPEESRRSPKAAALDWPAIGQYRESLCFTASRQDPRDLQAGLNLGPANIPLINSLAPGFGQPCSDPSSGQGVTHDSSTLGQARTTSGDTSEGVAVAVSALTFGFEYS